VAALVGRQRDGVGVFLQRRAHHVFHRAVVPRWMTSAPCPWMRRRMMLIAASWPSNSEAAVTKRSGEASGCGVVAGTVAAGVLMGRRSIRNRRIPHCTAQLVRRC
jgi:hypothetical protein